MLIFSQIKARESRARIPASGFVVCGRLEFVFHQNANNTYTP